MDRHLAEARSLKSGRPLARPARAADKELEAGSRAHYDDAAYYTKTYQRRKDDVAYYVELARRHGGKVLEYGVGNGRIALPVARQRIAVTGLDLSRPMLDDFESQLALEPAEVRRRVTLRWGDMRRVRFRTKFDLITCPFNAFLHLYTRDDVERFLAKVLGHLAPGGTFAFDVSMPNAHELVRDPNRAYYCPRFRYPSTGEMVRYTERFDYDQARQILFVMMEFFPEGHPKDSWVTPLAHRQFYPQELEALLYANGLTIERAWGDYKKTALDRYSEVMVFETRRRRGFRSSGRTV
ncbi:MAG TPA: class I SAM-dependent methyltransferase [Polyangiaceae bacterium]|nr:class I SAM-dependent methyltransferase [Polyangiaceae bacterium]